MTETRSVLRRKRYIFLLFAVALVFVLYAANLYIPVQSGLSYQGQIREAKSVKFLSDVSWQEPDGTRRVEQTLFDEALTMISNARQFILLDMFLFNNFQGPVPETTRALSSELTEALIAQQNLHPNITITVITDPINTVYGGLENVFLSAMSDAGINVVMTNLARLRNSNPVYSFFWYWLIRPWGNSVGGDALPNPFGEGRVGWRSYLALLNLKANHRKILVTDSPPDEESSTDSKPVSAATVNAEFGVEEESVEYSALVMSANPHDGSSAHRNVGLRFSGAAAVDIIESENAVLALSGVDPLDLPALRLGQKSEATIQILTESRIKEAILALLGKVAEQDRVRLLLFYLSDRDVISALKSAADRGAKVQVILDVNHDAFGRKKNGIPNKPVAQELVDAGIDLRWCDTSGEQCHAKILLLESNSEFALLQGSANFTRRNLNDFNLETDVLLTSSTLLEPMTAAIVHFDELWQNANERSYTAAYDSHQDKSLVKKWLYRFMEASGLSTF